MFAWLLGLLIVVLVACGWNPPPPHLAPVAQCSTAQVIMVPGTFETHVGADPAVPVGLLAQVGAQLPKNVTVTYTPYPATFWAPFYFDSARAGMDTAAAEMQATHTACPKTVFALVGYSQGADVVGNLAADIGRGLTSIPPASVVAVGMISDPQRNPATETLIGPAVPGQGVEGARAAGYGELSNRMITVCAPGDLVCSYTPTTPPPTVLDMVNQYQAFQASGVHQSYGTYPVQPGVSATTYMASWLTGKISR